MVSTLICFWTPRSASISSVISQFAPVFFGTKMLLLTPRPQYQVPKQGGSGLPVAVAHGEGYAEFADATALKAAQPLVALRFVDNAGTPTELMAAGFVMIFFVQVAGNSMQIFASEVFPTNARASGFGWAAAPRARRPRPIDGSPTGRGARPAARAESISEVILISGKVITAAAALDHE